MCYSLSMKQSGKIEKGKTWNTGTTGTRRPKPGERQRWFSGRWWQVCIGYGE